MYHSDRARKNYPEMYFLSSLISEGDTCIDIGANVGYYSIPLAEIVGTRGKVYAVEPVPLFRKILEKNLKRYNLSAIVKLLPYALSNTDNAEIEMGTPSVNGLVHFGYTKVLNNDVDEIKNKYRVKSVRPQKLFSDLKELQFIKCDIEGYEDKVIPEFAEIINRFKPILQIEICSEKNRRIIIDMLQKIGYKVFYLFDNLLIELEDINHNLHNNCDLYFIHKQNIFSLQHLLKNNS